jgi:3-oxoacyl-[acyl-carrier-protein] synthase II
MSAKDSLFTAAGDWPPAPGHRPRSAGHRPRSFSSGNARRIAITGYGAISAHGVGVEAFTDGLRAGRCAIGTLTHFAAEGYRSTCAAEVGAFELPATLSRALRRRASRTAQLALVAADEAWRMAALQDASGCGVVVGTTTGGMAIGEESYRLSRAAAAPRVPLAAWLELPVNVTTDAVATAMGCAGPRLTVSTACSTGANALAVAADWIRHGRATAVLCGGSDSLCQMTYSGFNALQALDRVPCRPFDRSRAGLSLGEGAAMFVLEAWEAARARGAIVLGELVGYGVTADAHHLTQPRPDGAAAALAMRRALEESGVRREEIDYINAHGTGTQQNDVVETRVIKTVLGDRAYRVPVSSTKSMIGHTLGAAGALEALAALLAVRNGFVPPTASLVEPDPECDLDYVPRASRAASPRTVLSNSYGFGGNNTTLVLRSADD